MNRKVFIHKGVNNKKPKRWYIVKSSLFENGDEYYVPYYTWYQIERIEKFFSKTGFKLCKKRQGDFSYEIFFYFRSNAEEARFIMNYSNGIEIDI